MITIVVMLTLPVLSRGSHASQEVEVVFPPTWIKRSATYGIGWNETKEELYYHPCGGVVVIKRLAKEGAVWVVRRLGQRESGLAFMIDTSQMPVFFEQIERACK